MRLISRRLEDCDMLNEIDLLTNSTLQNEFTALMLACSLGKAKKVDALLDHPNINVNAARTQVRKLFNAFLTY